MVEQTIVASQIPIGSIIAEGVAYDEYMARYAGEHCEWVRGYVIKMSPVTMIYERLVQYVRMLLNAYFAINPVGTVFGEPFVMRTEIAPSGREPDLQIILNDNPGQLTQTAMIGPADIVIEVVSAESVARDYGEKFEEYEKAGVREYWVLDPIRSQTLFYRLGEDGIYNLRHPDSDGNYTTPLLPNLALHVPTLWQDKLPDFFAIGQAVQAMFADS